MPAVSVLIPTYQRREHLRRALVALADQTLAATEFDVVVSVDGSTDGTSAMLRDLTVPYHLHVLEGANRGRAGAINAALAVAHGELVVLLDDDMEPGPGLLAAHRVRHAGGARLGVIGAVPVRVAPDAPPATRWIGERFNRHLANLARADYRPLFTDFYSGNFSVRRDVLASLDGFDASFTRYGNEDLELSVRLAQAGVTLVYDPAALAWQTNDKRFAELARDKREEGRTAVLLATKHPAAFAQLKLATFAEGPSANRALRAALLALARRWSVVPEAIVRMEEPASLLPATILARVYPQALGYFFWLGVRDALAEQPEAARRCPPLQALGRELGA